MSAEIATQRIKSRSFVETTDVEMTYTLGSHPVQALRGVSLHVPRGQFLCIRGRSGSGKSSLLHAIGTLRKPTSGRIRIGDLEVHELKEREAALFRRRVVGVVFQFFNLLPMLSVAENVAFPLSLEGTRGRSAEDRVDAILDELGMLDRRKSYPDQLSGGQMQRVAIARAMIIDPEVILADEPTGNLDSATGNHIWRLLQELSARRHVTTIMVTHDADATAYADRVVVLEDGRIVEDTDADSEWATRAQPAQARLSSR